MGEIQDLQWTETFSDLAIHVSPNGHKFDSLHTILQGGLLTSRFWTIWTFRE